MALGDSGPGELEGDFSDAGGGGQQDSEEQRQREQERVKETQQTEDQPSGDGASAGTMPSLLGNGLTQGQQNQSQNTQTSQPSGGGPTSNRQQTQELKAQGQQNQSQNTQTSQPSGGGPTSNRQQAQGQQNQSQNQAQDTELSSDKRHAQQKAVRDSMALAQQSDQTRVSGNRPGESISDQEGTINDRATQQALGGLFPNADSIQARESPTGTNVVVERDGETQRFNVEQTGGGGFAKEKGFESNVVREQGAPPADDGLVQRRVERLESQIRQQYPSLTAEDYRIVVGNRGLVDVQLDASGRRKTGLEDIRARGDRLGDTTDIPQPDDVGSESALSAIGEAPDSNAELRSELEEQGTINQQQGVETTNQQAADFEQRIVKDNPFVDNADEVTIVEEGNTLRASLTEVGRERARERFREERRQAGEYLQRAPASAQALNTRGENELAEVRTQLEQRGPNDARPTRTRRDQEVEEVRQNLEQETTTPGNEPAPDAAALTTSDRELAEGELKARRREQSREQFGDNPIYIGGTRLETYLKGVTTHFGKAAQKAKIKGGILTDPDFYLGNTLADDADFSDGVRREDFSDEGVRDMLTQETTSQKLAGGFYSGATNTFAAPASATLAAKELGELGIDFSGTVADDVGEGDFSDTKEYSQEVGKEGGEAVGRFSDYASNNPAEFSGSVAGSLVISAGAMGAAGATSSRAGVASRFAIQPGEEIASAAGTRVLSRTATGSKILSKFPGGKLDNEEIAIKYGAKGARAAKRKRLEFSRRLRSAGYLSDRKGFRSFLEAERAQLNLVPPTEVESGQGETVDRIDSLTDEELSRAARESLELTEYEINRDFGEEQFSSVPEFEETFDKQDRAAEDITGGVSGRGDPAVASGDVETTFEENFNRAIQRQKQEAETPSVAFDEEADTLARQLEDTTFEREEAQSAELEADTESEARSAAEAMGGFGEERVQAVPGVRAELFQRPFGQEDFRGDFGSEFGRELGRESELLGETELALERESEVAQEYELGLEQELGLENEFEFGMESETESEYENEIELGTESEYELEAEPKDVKKRDEKRSQSELAFYEDQYTVDIPSAAEVFGFDFDQP